MVGTLDVDGMLKSMPAGLFQEWCEFDRLKPIGINKLTEVVAEFAAMACTHWGFTLEGGQQITKEYFMPWLKLTQPAKQPAGYVTAEEAERQKEQRRAHRS